MSRAEPGKEIQPETIASTAMKAKVSQVLFRNPRSPRQRGACVPPHAGRHNPTRIHDGGQYRFREGTRPTEWRRSVPVASIDRRSGTTRRQQDAVASASQARSSIVMPFPLRCFFVTMSEVQALPNAPWITRVVEGGLLTWIGRSLVPPLPRPASRMLLPHLTRSPDRCAPSPSPNLFQRCEIK
jgi:hypothetical protein